MASESSSLLSSDREERLKELVRYVTTHDAEGQAYYDAMMELTELLPEEDEENLESDWHRDAMNFLIEIIAYHFRDREKFFVGGNMFIYYSMDKVLSKDFRGPDVFLVHGAERGLRGKWVVWQENRYPSAIIELLSPSTSVHDRTVKKEIYAKEFRTPEYFLYDPESQQLEGWMLSAGEDEYEPIPLNDEGRARSKQMDMWLGTWKGPSPYTGVEGVWLRGFDDEGNLCLIGKEDERQQKEQAKDQAEQEAVRAEVQQQRADSLEGELERVKNRLAELEKIVSEHLSGNDNEQSS